MAGDDKKAFERELGNIKQELADVQAKVRLKNLEHAQHQHQEILIKKIVLREFFPLFTLTKLEYENLAILDC